MIQEVFSSIFELEQAERNLFLESSSTQYFARLGISISQLHRAVSPTSIPVAPPGRPDSSVSSESDEEATARQAAESAVRNVFQRGEVIQYSDGYDFAKAVVREDVHLRLWTIRPSLPLTTALISISHSE